MNYAFIEEVTRARTATVSIDFGDGEWHKFRVATNVNRGPQGTYQGVTLTEVMNLIGYEYQAAVAYDRTDPPTRFPSARFSNQVRPPGGIWLYELDDLSRFSRNWRNPPFGLHVWCP